jgi:hypothetical protein
MAFNQVRIAQIDGYRRLGIYPLHIQISVVEEHDVVIHSFQNQCWFQFGKAPGQNGIRLRAEVVLPTDGTLSWIQNTIVNRKKSEMVSGKARCIDSKGAWWLDRPRASVFQKTKSITLDPKTPPNQQRTSLEMSDSPGFCVSDPPVELASAADQFRSILLWAPQGHPSIPIGSVEWTWSGSVLSNTTDNFGPCYRTDQNGTKYYWKVDQPKHSSQVVADFNTPDPVMAPTADPNAWQDC